MCVAFVHATLESGCNPFVLDFMSADDAREVLLREPTLIGFGVLGIFIRQAKPLRGTKTVG
jgi:hypothetical protein